LVGGQVKNLVTVIEILVLGPVVQLVKEEQRGLKNEWVFMGINGIILIMVINVLKFYLSRME
jgi:L-lactate permease